MSEKLIPKIIVNPTYFAPKYIVFEITNVGTISARDVKLDYSVEEGGFRHKLVFPLMRVGEIKILFPQKSNGEQIVDTSFYRDNEITLDVNITYLNALAGGISDEYNAPYEFSQKINLTEFVVLNETTSVQFKEETIVKIGRNIDNIARSIDRLERNTKKMENEFSNGLNLKRLTFQNNILQNKLESVISDDVERKHVLDLVEDLTLILMNPYPDLHSDKIQPILNNIKRINTTAYDKVWDIFSALEWARVTR